MVYLVLLENSALKMVSTPFIHLGTSCHHINTYQIQYYLLCFSYVFRLYSQAGSPLSKKEFARAAKISMNNGEELSANVIDVVFALFDRAGK